MTVHCLLPSCWTTPGIITSIIPIAAVNNNIPPHPLCWYFNLIALQFHLPMKPPRGRLSAELHFKSPPTLRVPSTPATSCRADNKLVKKELLLLGIPVGLSVPLQDFPFDLFTLHPTNQRYYVTKRWAASSSSAAAVQDIDSEEIKGGTHFCVVPAETAADHLPSTSCRPAIRMSCYKWTSVMTSAI